MSSRLGGLADWLGADERAVAQDGDAVGQLEHFLEPVADVDQRDALRLQPADQREQLGRLRPGEIGGGLVEDQELRPAQGGPRGGHQLLLADGERAQHDARRDAEAEVVEHTLRLALHAPLVQDAEAGVLVAEEQVGRDRQVRAQHDFLVHRVDAEIHRVVGPAELDDAALPDDLAARFQVHAGQQLDERGLACAVLADDGVDLPRLEGEVDMLQRVRAGEALVEFSKFEEGRHRRHARAWPGHPRPDRGVARMAGSSPAMRAERMVTSPSGSAAPGCGRSSCSPW